MLALVAVIIIAALGIGAVLLLSRAPTSTPPPPPPSGPTLSSVAISVAKGTTTLDQSSSVTLSAKATDTNNNDVTANSTFTWTATPASDVTITHPGAASTAVVTANLGGTPTVTVTASWNGVSKTANQSLTINPLHFYVSANTYHPNVGSPFVLYVRVALADNSTDTAFVGTVHFTSTDPTATLPPDTSFSLSDQGLRAFTNVTVNATGAVQITATDTVFTSITGSVAIHGNTVPVAAFTVTANPANPEQALFDATASSDADGDSLSYTWNFGDGNTTSVTTATISHTYATAAKFTITLTVYDTWLASNVTTGTYTAHISPTASFHVVSEKTNATSTGVQVEFDASASTGGDGSVASYQWIFGDGSPLATTTSALEFHNYSNSYDGSNVNVNLTVTNSFGFLASIFQTVAISTAALPPIASFTLSINNNTRTVSVDGSASHPQTGAPIVYYNWNWGDGSPILNVTIPTASHAYSADGTYTITLTVVDSLNLKGSTSESAPVKLVTVPPIPSFTVSRNFMNVSVDASATTAPSNNLAWFTWNWGDGSPLQSYPATQPLATHTYVAPGKYTITLTANTTTNQPASTTRDVSVSNNTLDYTYSDFFNVPYGEWWDMRTSHYGDLPPNVNCFNATSIKDSVCRAAISGIPNAETAPPYTNWYPAPFGSLFYQQPGNDPFVYAPYRVNAVGQQIPGYNLSEPVFLPVANYAAAPGNVLDFHWNMQYLDVANATALTNAGCSGVSPKSDDGFMIRSKVYLTMDWQEARRIFGLPSTATTNAAVTSWFGGEINPSCATTSPLESAWTNWLTGEGNGKYDIWNSFQYTYTQFYTNFSNAVVTGTSNTNGMVSVAVDMSAWGTEVLMSRWFYWGNASYQADVLNSMAAKGWWGMELAWFEDLHFNGALTSFGMSFNLNTVVQYHFQMGSLPGPDGCLRSQTTCTEATPSDDVPFWSWGPFLSDYVPASSKHPTSELTRWNGLTYIHTTPGGGNYGLAGAYDYAPDSWPARAGEQWHFVFPAVIPFFNPATASIPQNPQVSFPFWSNNPTGVGYVLYATNPASYGTYNNTLWTWDVAGNGPWLSFPSGWPTGAPGSYPNVPWGSITFIPAGAKVALAAPLAAPGAASVGSAPAVSPSGAVVVAVLSPSFVVFALLAMTPLRWAFWRPRRVGR